MFNPPVSVSLRRYGFIKTLSKSFTPASYVIKFLITKFPQPAKFPLCPGGVFRSQRSE